MGDDEPMERAAELTRAAFPQAWGVVLETTGRLFSVVGARQQVGAKTGYPKLWLSDVDPQGSAFPAAAEVAALVRHAMAKTPEHVESRQVDNEPQVMVFLPCPILDMDEIVRLLHEVHGIRDAYVEQTGGGCATIYAGKPYPYPEPEGGDWNIYPIAAGPGWFEGPAWTKGRATTAEFFVGPNEGDGNSEGYTLPHDADEAYAARLIAVNARLFPVSPARIPTPQELTAVGIMTCVGGALADFVDHRPTGGSCSGTCTTCDANYVLGDKDGAAVPHLPKYLAGQPVAATMASDLARALLTQIAKHGDRPVHGLDSGVDKVFRGVTVGGFDADGLDDDSGPAIVMNLTENAKYRQEQGDAIDG